MKLKPLLKLVEKELKRRRWSRITTIRQIRELCFQYQNVAETKRKWKKK